MSKRGNMVHEMLAAVRKQTRYGDSRHEAKAEARQRASDTGTRYEQPRGIRGFGTAKTYTAVGNNFINWVLDNHRTEVAHLKHAERFVPEFLAAKQAAGLSNYSLHTYGAALSCIYDKTPEELGVPRYERKVENITRTRDYKPASDLPQQHQIAAEFSRATGLRRAGLEHLHIDYLREREDGRLEVFVDKQGAKGGRERWVPVLKGREDFVRSVFDRARERSAAAYNGSTRVFSKSDIPQAVHCYRAEYARDLVDEVQREHDYTDNRKYYGRGPHAGQHWDRAALAYVSRALGHGEHCPDDFSIDEIAKTVTRLNVVVNHYL